MSGTSFGFADNRNKCGVFIMLSRAVPPLDNAPGLQNHYSGKIRICLEVLLCLGPCGKIAELSVPETSPSLGGGLQKHQQSFKSTSPI